MIRPIDADQLRDSKATPLVLRVFGEFEAPEYSDEGVREFQEYVDERAMEQRLRSGELLMWGYFVDGRVVGVIAMRPIGHVSLLFVDKEHHRRGIARRLLDVAVSTCMKRSARIETTVNSSPYAVGFYRKLGFVETDGEQTLNGIRFVPMKRTEP